MKQIVAVIFGLGLLCNALLFVPQAVAVWRKKTDEGISLITFGARLREWLCCGCDWLRLRRGRVRGGLYGTHNQKHAQHQCQNGKFLGHVMLRCEGNSS